MLAFKSTMPLDESWSVPFPAESGLGYSKAKVAASKDNAINKSAFPELCPWSYSQLLDVDYYPDLPLKLLAIFLG